MRTLGFADAELTRHGSDGGVDIRANSAIAQVKARLVRTSRPEVQQLAGIAQHEGKLAIFFAVAGFTTEAMQWANDAGVAMFSLDSTGTARPIGHRAALLIDEPARPSAPAGPRYEPPSEIKRLMTRLTVMVAGGSVVRDILLCGRSADALLLARFVAARLARSLHAIRATELRRVGDIGGVLAGMSPGILLYLSEVDSLSRDVRSVLAKAVESRQLDLVIGEGTSRRSICLDLPPWPIIASTDKPEFLDPEFKAAFSPTISALNMTVVVPTLSSEDSRAIEQESKRVPST